MLRTGIVWASLTLVVAACSGQSTTDGSSHAADSGEGQHDGSTDGTLADVQDGDDSMSLVTDAGGGADTTLMDATDAMDAPTDVTIQSPCSPGGYAGTLVGNYTSHLTGVGIPIPIAGDVAFTLGPPGSPGMSCMFNGGSADCGDVLRLQSGTVTGTADAVHSGDATTGGFPFFCSITTGSLDCRTTTFVGWIECTYCIGPLADGGMSCAGPGVGGGWAGPMTANYGVASHAFIMGTWNGSEALRGNDGTSPGPDGAPISDFLSDSGSYFGPNDFGGSGTWSAAHP